MTFERSFVRKDPAAVLDYQFLWAPWLAGDTIETSDMSVPPEITLETETNATTTATVWLSGGTAGETYRVVNTVVTVGGRTEDWVLLVAMDGVDAEAAGSYLSPDDAAARLWGRYDIQVDLKSGDLYTATYELDSYARFIGERQADDQALAFPRTLNPDGTDNAEITVPDAVLDWVALRAYQLSVNEGPPVKSESVLDQSVTYAFASTSQTAKRMAGLLTPYLAREPGFASIEVASTFVD